MKKIKNYVCQQFIFTICLAVLSVFFLPQETLAADGQDLEPPTLASIIISPAAIDVTGGSATVTVTINVTDDLSGFQSGHLTFQSPSREVNKRLYFNINDRTGGTAINGTYKEEIVFPQFSEAGDWDLTQVMLQDVTTNLHYYYESELVDLGLNRLIAVISEPDTTDPSLFSISFSSPEVMSDDSLSVTMTATISDDLSGFNSGYFFMKSSSGQNKTFSIGSNNLIDGGPFLGTYSTTVSLPQYSEAGIWLMTATTNLRDKAGNIGRVNPVEFPGGTFTVTTLPDDVLGPEIKEFSFTEVINTIYGPDTAKFTPRFTDNLSGLRYVSASIVSPSGGQRHNLGWGPSSLIDGDANDGTYEFNKLFPQYSEYGEWTIASMYLRDVTENRTIYSASALENLGLPTTLKVSGIISDGSGNYIIDSGGGTISTNDGILEVYFPPGAVDDGQEITITAVGEFDPVDIKIGTNVLGEGNVIAEYIFDPDGLSFYEPVTVTMTIDVTEFNQNKRNRLGVYLNVDTDDDGVEDTFDLIASTVTTVANSDDTVDMVFVFLLDHFSTYAVIEEIVDDIGTDTDTVPPIVAVTVPAEGNVIQGPVTLAATATDDSSIKSASFTIREVNGGEGLVIGYENIPATQEAGTDNWILADFDSGQLLDGYYLIFATAKDASDSENEGTSEVVSFSVRNWSLTDLLPPTKTNRPGRTMPVKFSLRLDYDTDPSMPFVYNEELEIRIYETGGIGLLQTSRFGVLSTDYRIDNVKEHYITNFKTSKTPSGYLVEIWRTSGSDGVEDVLLDDFYFETKRK